MTDHLPRRLGLPAWAKRTNPIVRRHLGTYWKTIPPDIEPLLVAYLVQVVLIFLSVPIPFIMSMAVVFVVSSVVILPFAFYAYGRVLLNIAIDSAAAMSAELHNDTLDLLRTTPISLQNIFLGKVAAAIWRQMEDLSLLMAVAVGLSLPLLVNKYAVLWDPATHPYLPHLAIVLALAVSCVRLVLEPVMIGSVGVLIGSTVSYKSTAVTTTTALGILYFVFLFLLQYAPIGDAVIPHFIIDMVVPIVMPLIITWGALKIAALIVSLD